MQDIASINLPVFSKRFHIHSWKPLTTNFAPKENPLKTKGKNESKKALQSLKDFQRKSCNKNKRKALKSANAPTKLREKSAENWRENRREKTKVAEKKTAGKNGSAENVTADPYGRKTGQYTCHTSLHNSIILTITVSFKRMHSKPHKTKLTQEKIQKHF